MEENSSTTVTVMFAAKECTMFASSWIYFVTNLHISSDLATICVCKCSEIIVTSSLFRLPAHLCMTWTTVVQYSDMSLRQFKYTQHQGLRYKARAYDTATAPLVSRHSRHEDCYQQIKQLHLAALALLCRLPSEGHHNSKSQQQCTDSRHMLPT